ncbi:UDP-4-amino-4,6-dideoxy-N-acetyl-beta-L-altrosamine transaminase [Jutongia huaianensis]|uniref:UDP-4-amino-4, 6-dideoxy-N-acetyl-beta-L-altrosamine transaminase n=1 Tax=Jutongia huaianensis TaxID=2763668 RepID=A0ABR7N5B0_9FIRM|nr:UDP-4-amino-4,6-dideoxy-N-acetyl-beta-L-altrosamine transaminase [Jutongia huaianensis]MBC8563555.1 UDP-4-amino-4,6-dideoxy-N-acetyl-beta-L-altrosamine transaminase [Jutongia huaianensis]
MYIPYGRQSIDDADIEAVVKVLKSDYLTTGPAVAAFEKKVADYVGAKYAVAVSNGTAALHVACLAAGIGEGDEVITTPITFAASANCVLYCGGTPVFADIDPDTYNISPEELEKKITSRTKAIIPVHYTGQPCDMDAILEIAHKHNLLVVEDGAHALGAAYKGKKIGSIADMTCFSFHPVKPVTTGEGGMIVTDNEELYRRLVLYRSHGITRDKDMMQQYEEQLQQSSDPALQEAADMLRGDVIDPGGWYYQQLELGYNYRITDISCALGASQMDKLDHFLERRRQIAKKYDEAFADIPQIKTPWQQEGCQSGWHLYMIQTMERSRREVFEGLRQAGIGVNVHYIPVYRHPYYQRNGYAGVHCLNAEAFYERAISLPIFPGLTGQQQDYVIEHVIKECTAIKS